MSESSDEVELKPIWIGVDWAKDSGFNQGDIISIKGDVIEVRFQTVTVKAWINEHES